MAEIHSSINAYAFQISYLLSLTDEELKDAEHCDPIKDEAAHAYAAIIIEAKQDADLLIYGIIYGMLYQCYWDSFSDDDDAEEPSAEAIFAKLHEIYKEIQDIASAKYIALGFSMA